jgi:hypothetical protein
MCQVWTREGVAGWWLAFGQLFGSDDWHPRIWLCCFRHLGKRHHFDCAVVGLYWASCGWQCCVRVPFSSAVARTLSWDARLGRDGRPANA